MRRGQRLTGHTLVLVVGGAGSQAVYAVLLAVVANRSGPERFGVLAGLLAAGGLLVGLLDYGLTGYSLRELAAGRMTRGGYRRRLGTVLLVGTGTGAVGCLVTLPLLPAGVAPAVLLVVLSRTLVTGVLVPLRAERRVVAVALLMLVERGVALAGVLLLPALTPLGVLGGFWVSIAAGALVTGALGYRVSGLSRAGRGVGETPNPWRGVSGYGRFTLAVSAGTFDVALLGLVGGSGQAGLYGAVSRWTQPIALLTQAFSTAAAPILAGAASARAALDTLRRAGWLVVAALAACGGVILLAPQLTTRVLGPGYAASGAVLALLAAGAGVAVVNQPVATFLQSRQDERFVGGATVTTVAVQLAGVVLTAGPLGARGAAGSYLVSQGVLLVVLLLRSAAVLRRPIQAAEPVRPVGTGPRVVVEQGPV